MRSHRIVLFVVEGIARSNLYWKYPNYQPVHLPKLHVYIYIYFCLFIYVFILYVSHQCAYYVCIYIYICTQCVCVYACMYVCMYVCTYVRMHVCMYVWNGDRDIALSQAGEYFVRAIEQNDTLTLVDLRRGKDF